MVGVASLQAIITLINMYIYLTKLGDVRSFSSYYGLPKVETTFPLFG